MSVVHPQCLCRAPHKDPGPLRVKDAGRVSWSSGDGCSGMCVCACKCLSPGIDRPLSLLEHNKGTIDWPGATELLAH